MSQESKEPTVPPERVTPYVVVQSFRHLGQDFEPGHRFDPAHLPGHSVALVRRLLRAGLIHEQEAL